MRYSRISEGCITERQPGTPTSSVSAPRCAVNVKGDIICTFIAQSELGKNDFIPMITRSYDIGETWTEPEIIWPDLVSHFSIFGSLSADASGELLFYGTRTPIDKPGESFWSDDTQGLKQNELVWTRSADSGRTWSEFQSIPMPFAGSAEAPGAMYQASNGRLLCCYAPYNTFDPELRVKRNQVICLWSDDEGASWNWSIMLAFPNTGSNGAEAWLAELEDGRMLGVSWHVQDNADAPNAYAISNDFGTSWSKTLSTGVMGQSTALLPLQDKGILFLYNQRKVGDKGVWMALAKPTVNDFGIQLNQRVWAAENASRPTASVNFDSWTDFSFGEPSAIVLPDKDVLVTLWSSNNSKGVIAYVKIRLSE